MSKGVWKRVNQTLVPVSAEAKESLMAVKDDAKCVADVRGTRNADQHRLYFALCQLCADATDSTKDGVRKWLAYRLGHVETWFDLDGRMHIDPKSIAYESLAQAEFHALFQASVHLIAERLGSAPAEVQARFDDLVSGKRAA